MDLEIIQRALVKQGIDGWLFYDFRRSNGIAYRTLGLPEDLIVTRRWYYYVPRSGSPTGLVSALEPHNLDALPGDKIVYRTWQERRSTLAGLLAAGSTVAMEYSPLNDIPYVSLVDAGTVDLVRSFGVGVVSSAELVQGTWARWSGHQWASHEDASRRLMEIKDRAFAELGERLRLGRHVTDYGLQQFMVELYAAEGLISDDPPIVATNEHCSNPHYLPTEVNETEIRRGDTVLVDFWAKKAEPYSVYADHTWMAFAGEAVPARLQEVFSVAAGARDSAIEFVREAFRTGRVVRGWEVDDVARNYVAAHGFGDYFIHRTGHSIDEDVHGSGANMDNYETHDDRIVLTETCFSIEPGIYLPDFGVRTEVDVFITGSGRIIVTGAPIQNEVVPLLAGTIQPAGCG
jgi:Xaa-Pro dipeptidase